MSRYTWVPYVAAAAGASLITKGTLIIASGNTISDGPMGVLYLGGLAFGLVAAVGAGLRQRGWLRSLAVDLGSALLLVVWIMGLGDAIKPAVGVFSGAEYVQVEVPVVAAGLVLVLLALRARAHDTRTMNIAVA
jgi:hypothetical protein